MYAHVRLWRAPSDANHRLWISWKERVDEAESTNWVVSSVGLGLLSGILWQVQPANDDPQSAGELTRGLVSMSSLLSPREKEVYDKVVKQLANRGFRLGELLTFWKRLIDGQLMPGFDPQRSLTNDVVRRAIIPETRLGYGGCALATKWSSAETKPQVMVTHNWTNGFGSLVSAILADALGRASYQEVAAQIATASGLERVQEKLGGKQETTYWVCAFCINQHASICAGFGPEPPQGTPEWAAWDRRRHDSVTGEGFVLCNCLVEKVFSHTDARCELNKFDDMMTHLAQQVGRFAQLIVVDDAFDVLYRAWCVAEIFEANVLGMESRIQVSSQDAVDQNYDRLSLLDVRQCTASSQADKEMIMAKIADVEVFNWKIQQLVFGEEMGLFSQWVDGNERSRQVGRILRRCVIRAESTQGKSVRPSRRCCASFRLLASLSDDSEVAATEEETQKKGFQIGNVFVQCLCSEIMRFDIALNNWQFLPKPELKDNTTKKKLRLGIPTGPKKGNDTFETEPSDPPVYSWARGGMFIYKGTKESLNNEVLTIEVLGQKAGQWAPQGKALVGLRGAIDYPIAVGVVKILTTSKNDYVQGSPDPLGQRRRQGRAGGSISMAMRSLALKPGQNDEDSSVPRPMQDLTSLTMYYIQGSVQHLVVTVNGADGLPVADPDYGSSNPFVRVKYDGTVEQSPVVMASLAPCWNHTFYIPVRFIDPCIYKDKAYKKNIFPEELVESFCPELWSQMSRTAVSARTVALHKTGRSFAVIQGLALDAFDSLDDRKKLACAARQIQELCDRSLELIRASSVHEEEEEDEPPDEGGEAEVDSDLGAEGMLLTLLKISTSMSFSAAADRTSAIRQEMKSKGFLDIEVWHWDGVPTEFLGAFKLDLQKTRFGQQVERALCRDVVKTKQIENTTDEADREKDDTGDATVGIDPALAKVHNTLMYEGRREKITGSSLATMGSLPVSWLLHIAGKNQNGIDESLHCHSSTSAPAYKRGELSVNRTCVKGAKLDAKRKLDGVNEVRKLMSCLKFEGWKEVFSELNEARKASTLDDARSFGTMRHCGRDAVYGTLRSLEGEGKVLPLPRLITPLALPADLGSPLAIMHWIKCIEYNAPARQRACGQINLWQTPSDILALRRGSVQDHAVLLCCALQGLKKDAWVCVGSVEGGNEHTWVMTREGYGTVTFWEVTTGAKYHLGQRWLSPRIELTVLGFRAPT
ncbi:cep76 [Symbiodinium sp. KB8]|nr:cep76 [Symbiodinium sp. KB8]